jgi:DNA-binding MarR family transcriptional regulator
MTELLDMSDYGAIMAVISGLRKFAQYDTKMQVSTVLTLLEIAAARTKGEAISVQDIEKNVGMQSGTSSRNVYYWGEGHKDMKGGLEYITIDFDPQDRRKRSLALTNKGKAFINELIRGVKASGKATG